MNRKSATPFSGSPAVSRWTPELMIRSRRVGGIALSPDGKRVAYTVTAAVARGSESAYESQIWVATPDGAHNSRISSDGASCSEPAFSPDGTALAFLAARGTDEQKQLWISQLAPGEAEQITDSAGGVVAFRWSPDGARIAFTSPVSEAGRGHDHRISPRETVVADEDLHHAHIHLLNTESRGNRNIRRLTRGTVHITSFDWSPDGKTIAFAHQSNPSPDAIDTNDISTVNVDNGEIRPLVRGSGADVTPLFSPDGSWVAFASDGGKPHWAHTMDIAIVPSGGGTSKKLAETPGRYTTLIAWDPRGEAVYVMELDRTSNRVFSLPVNGAPPRIVTGGEGTFSSAAISRDGSVLACVHERTEVPPDVYSGTPGKFIPARVSRIGADFEGRQHARTEVIRWRAKDGTEIEGLLTHPLNQKRGKPAPLILQLHGGPASAFQQWYTGAASVYPAQAFAEEGFAMLCPNPRGSDGYGKQFRYANLNDWGGEDVNDVMAGVDHCVAHGYADPARLAVCGWSYGGYLTACIIASTNRFKAASVGAGIINIASFAGTTDIPGYVRDYFGGEPWERPDLYAARSPLLRAGAIVTPTQIIHGGSDVRVPPSQGQELYTALRRRGIPTEFVLYPGMPHGATDPETIVDCGRRAIAWFKAHVSV